jgi:hypothetical protein
MYIDNNKIGPSRSKVRNRVFVSELNIKNPIVAVANLRKYKIIANVNHATK